MLIRRRYSLLIFLRCHILNLMICYQSMPQEHNLQSHKSKSANKVDERCVCARIFILHVHMCPYTWRKIHNWFLCENGVWKNKVRFELGWKFLILRSWRSKLKRYTQFWLKPNPCTYYPKKKQDKKDHWFITKHLGSVSLIFNRVSF